MVRIKITAITGLNTSAFGVKCQEIIDNMTGDPTFATPSPTLSEVQTALDSYNALVVQSLSGNRNIIAQRNAQRDVVTSLLLELSSYVVYTVRNVAEPIVIVEGLGFNCAKPREKIGELPAPTDLISRVLQEPGAILLDWKGVYGAYSYVVEFTQQQVPNAVWTEIGTVTKSRFKATGLTPGQFYSFRVRSVGAAGYSEPSDVTTTVCG